MKVKLTRKLARILNGIDLAGNHEGDIINMPDDDARLLIAEGWAAPAGQEGAREQDRHRSKSSRSRR